MKSDLPQGFVIATVIGVESFPCSLIGQKKIFAQDGGGLGGNLQLPWEMPMEWLEKQLAELVRESILTKTNMVADLINPDEPDQIVKVMIELCLTNN